MPRFQASLERADKQTVLARPRKLTNFIEASRRNDPTATWVSQNLPLSYLFPVALWLGYRQGNLVLPALAWTVGAVIFNLYWLPYLRRKEHPPPHHTQSIAAAACTVGVFLTPTMWLLLSVFMGVGVGLGLASRTPWRHLMFQSFCVLFSTFYGISVDAGTLLAWTVFAVFVLPLGLSTIRFYSNGFAYEERLHLSLVSSGATAWDIKPNGEVGTVFGLGIEGVEVGTVLNHVIHKDDYRPAGLGRGQTAEYRIVAPDQSTRWVRETVEAASLRTPLRRSGVVDITAERLAAEDERRRARVDPVTGQNNRVSHLQKSDLWASRGVGHLILLDLDNFKQVNDTLGHSIGDRVLHQVAQRVAQVDTDSHLARLGGDEFACLVTGNAEQASATAERLLASVQEPLSIGQMIVHSGASAGIAPFAPDVPADEVRRRAGLALREAKSQGGIAVSYNAELEQNSSRRNELITRLPTALASGEIVAHFQPQLSLSNKRICGFEALVRWEHPDFGLLPPVAFLDLVAVGGHHRTLLTTVLDHALGGLSRLLEREPNLTISVNLHSQNLREPDLVQRVLDCLRRYGLQPGHLILELIEEDVVSDDKTVIHNLVDFDLAGIALSIDDFGTGFSSLSYLDRLPVTEVKLDRSLVVASTTSDRASAVTGFVMALADRLGIRVVAEGIEDQATAGHLIGHGCELGQGYFFGRPAPLHTWLDNPWPADALAARR